jgi:drug/metabolite transporter (DMT)-like permease
MRRTSGGEGAGLAAMAGCAFLWSTAGLLIKLVDWNPFAIACGRSLVAFLFIFAFVRRPRFTFSAVQVGAALASAVTMLLFVYANKTTSSANAILLQYGSPVYTAVIGTIVLKERPRAEQWLALAAVAIGMVLFFMDDLGGGNLAGDLAATAAGLAFAVYAVLMRAQKDGSPIESTLLAHAATALIAFGFALFLPAPRLGGRAVAAILCLGTLQIGLATLLFTYGIKRVSALQSMLVGVIEPVMNPVWVFLATGEAPKGKALAGGCIVVVAVSVSSIVTARRDAALARNASPAA